MVIEGYFTGDRARQKTDSPAAMVYLFVPLKATQSRLPLNSLIVANAALLAIRALPSKRRDCHQAVIHLGGKPTFKHDLIDMHESKHRHAAFALIRFLPGTDRQPAYPEWMKPRSRMRRSSSRRRPRNR